MSQHRHPMEHPAAAGMNEVAQDGLCEEDFTGDRIGKDRETLGTWDSVEGRHSSVSQVPAQLMFLWSPWHGDNIPITETCLKSSKNCKSHRVMLKA